MNYIQEAKLTSYELIVFEAEGYKNSISKVPKFDSSIKQLEDICFKISETKAYQETSRKGIAQDKKIVMYKLIELIVNLSGALQIYALDKKNETLYRKVLFKEYKLVRASAINVITAARILIDEADKVPIEELPEVGISPEDINKIKETEQEFKLIMSKPREAIIERSVLTKRINDLMEEAYKIKKYILDKLITQFRQKDPEFYFKYKKAAKLIINRGKQKVSSDENNREISDKK